MPRLVSQSRVSSWADRCRPVAVSISKVVRRRLLKSSGSMPLRTLVSRDSRLSLLRSPNAAGTSSAQQVGAQVEVSEIAQAA